MVDIKAEVSGCDILCGETDIDIDGGDIRQKTVPLFFFLCVCYLCE